MTHTIPPLDEVIDLIYQHANYCHRRMPAGALYDLEELEAHGRYVYVVWAGKFDPAKGCKFITGLWRCLANEFGNILARAHREAKRMQAPPTVDEDDGPDIDNVEAREYPDYSRVGDLVYTRLTRLEHLAARALLENPRIRKRGLYAKLGVKPQRGRDILHSLQMKLSEAASQVA